MLQYNLNFKGYYIFSVFKSQWSKTNVQWDIYLIIFLQREKIKIIPVTPTSFLTNYPIIWRKITKLYINLVLMGFWKFLCSYWGNWLSKPTPENVHCSVNLYFIHSRMVWKISAMENNSQSLQRSYYNVKTKHLSCKLC